MDRILTPKEYGQEEMLSLSKEDCKILYDYFKNTYITYEKPEVIELLREIREYALSED